MQTFVIDVYVTNSLGDFVDVFGITGGAFIKKYQLWSASSVMSAAKALLDKDFITLEGDAYFVYDQFFALWLLRGE